jgi:ribosomal protein L7/L12
LGPRKTSGVKLVRELLGLGLAEAVQFVENLPQTVARDLSWEEARSLARRFQQVEASVQLE